MASDPDIEDIDDFIDSDIIRAVPSGKAPATAAAASSSSTLPAHMLNPHSQAPTSTIPATADRSAYNSFQCLYPVYFDASRTRAEGRRVPSSLAVRNPLAREIANACSRLRLPTLLEPEKTHPQDWANPGRVKVGLKKVAGTGVTGAGVGIKNKHHLYRLVAEHLVQNPTTEESAGLRVRIGGQLQPEAGTKYPRPAVPRGWKVNELVPYLSAAMTGGGVSENLFKDMMKEMQGGGAGGDPMSALMAAAGGGAGGGDSDGGAATGGAKKKKEKKAKARN